MKYTIIGAGIGGLTTALAFEKKDIEYQIFEKAPVLTRVGNTDIDFYEKIEELKPYLPTNKQYRFRLLYYSFVNLYAQFKNEELPI